MPIPFNDDIPADEVNRILSYDPRTGQLRWKVRTNAHAAAGSIAGHLHAATGYIVITVKSKKYKAHRLAWCIYHGGWPLHEVDHKNGDKTDNRISNLRPATSSQNSCNSRLMRNNTSGRKGVCWDKRGERWIVNIQYQLKHKYVGSYLSFEEACEARARAEIEIHGQFARAG